MLEKKTEDIRGWQKIFDSITDLISVHDKDFKIIKVNKAFATTFKMKPKDFIGKTCYRIFHRTKTPPIFCPYRKALKTKKPTIAEIFEPHLGTHFEISISPVFNEKGKITACIHVAKDITERKKAEEELKKAYARLGEARIELIQAEKANAIVQLAGGVAHEVKNPLAIIMQATEYLKKNVHSQKEDIPDTLNMIMDNIKRADDIIRTLSDFVRITELNLKLQDIKPVITRSLDLIKHRVKLENIKVIKKFKEGLPKVLVDNAKIEQVLVNLLLNAVQAMPHGGKIFIRSYPTKLEKPQNRVGRRESDYFKVGEKAVIIEIEDTGIGISKENLQKLYTPFFTTKGPRGGAGLGLSVTRNIIDMHRGMIEVQSEENKGTKFIITLKTHGGE